ncbi:Methylenetetrahydrofolate reductase [Hyphomicrobium sp. MC1]|uniref:Methylenetetrahydrofolate reductase n=2 Tax=Pseudomonadota TaxID=1224 RepID=A0A0U2XG01_ECOLX|nr:MetF [Escherichia coli]CCB65489.1 Methylenetetrahydrofolate reductase [Hyphomicrobium sp. MC1]
MTRLTTSLAGTQPNEDGSSLASEKPLMGNISIELLPEHVATFHPTAANLKPGSFVFLTHIGGKSLAAQAGAAARIKAMGYEPVCHLGARNFTSRDEYANHLSALSDAGVTTVLMIGGNSSDSVPPMHSAMELLSHSIVPRTGIKRIFFAGHPEGHPSIPPEILVPTLLEKINVARELSLVPEIVTQFAFDGAAMAAWGAGLRKAGIDVPIRFGVAGVTSLPKLIKFAMLCGVGASLKGLSRQGGSILKAMRDQDPGDVISQLRIGTEAYALKGIDLHFFPFGGWEKTLNWIAASSGAH